MALNFPNSPINGETYSENGVTWVYDSSFGAWFVRSIAGTSSGGYYSGNDGNKTPENYGDIFRIHSNTLTQNVTILSGNNAIAAGPITITGDNTTLTIQTGSRVVII